MKIKSNILRTTLKLFCALIAMCLLLTAVSCGSSKTPKSCQHTWKAATCTSPKTCSLCKKTMGEALGHSWVDASCTAPQTCSVCKKTTQTALGHSWIDATCIAPKHCSVCETTDGTHNIYEHEGSESCSVCEINYYQTLLNFVLTRGTKGTFGSVYWSYEKTIYISGNAHKFKLQKNEDSNYISCQLSKDSKYFFTLYIEPDANGAYEYTFNDWYSTYVASSIDGTLNAATFTEDTTQLPYENYSSTTAALTPTTTSEHGTLYLKMLLLVMNDQFKSNSLPLSTKNFGFINYPGN